MGEYAMMLLEATKPQRSIFAAILFPFREPLDTRKQLIYTFDKVAIVISMQLERLVSHSLCW